MLIDLDDERVTVRVSTSTRKGFVRLTLDFPNEPEAYDRVKGAIADLLRKSAPITEAVPQ